MGMPELHHVVPHNWTAFAVGPLLSKFIWPQLPNQLLERTSQMTGVHNDIPFLD